MSIIKELKEKAITPENLLLENVKEMPNEILDYKKSKLDKFGIKNSTSILIEEKQKEKENLVKKNKTKVGKNEIIKSLKEMWGVHAVISYSTLDQIAKDHNLFITGLHKYSKPIPDENLEELELFTETLKNIYEKNNDWRNLRFSDNNRDFIFNITNNRGKYLNEIHLGNAFYIMCPKSHIKIDKKEDIIIGKEINSVDSKPSLNLDIKFNAPEPKDPIILLPFYIAGMIFTVIITSWDKVADDSRIRKLL